MNNGEFSTHEKANIRDARRDYNLHANIPKDLAQKEAQLTAHGYEVRLDVKLIACDYLAQLMRLQELRSARCGTMHEARVTGQALRQCLRSSSLLPRRRPSASILLRYRSNFIPSLPSLSRLSLTVE